LADADAAAKGRASLGGAACAANAGKFWQKARRAASIMDSPAALR